MKPALIATDLDGTFLGANAVLLQSNLAAARRAIEEGVVFVIATGRPRRWLDALAELRDLDPVVISSNGAAVGRLARPRPDFLHPIEPERALAFSAALPPELEVSFAVEYEYGWGREPGYPVGHFSGADQVAGLPELLAAGPVIKVLARTRHADTHAFSPVAVAAAGFGKVDDGARVAVVAGVEVHLVVALSGDDDVLVVLDQVVPVAAAAFLLDGVALALG